MFRSLSASLFWRGLLAVAIGIVAILWPSVTVLAVVVIFAVAVFIDAVHQATRAFSSERAGPVAGHLLLALVDVAAGVVAIAWPGITAWALTIWIGAWALVTGVGEFAMAFASHETAGERALYGFGGLLSVALGVALFARPGLGALSLAEVFGLFSLVFGIWGLVLAASTHATGSRLDRMLRATRPDRRLTRRHRTRPIPERSVHHERQHRARCRPDLRRDTSAHGRRCLVGGGD